MIVVLLPESLSPFVAFEAPVAVPFVVTPRVADLDQQLAVTVASHLNQPLDAVGVSLDQAQLLCHFVGKVVQLVRAAASHHASAAEALLNGLPDVVLAFPIELARRSRERNQCLH